MRVSPVQWDTEFTTFALPIPTKIACVQNPRPDESPVTVTVTFSSKSDKQSFQQGARLAFDTFASFTSVADDKSLNISLRIKAINQGDNAGAIIEKLEELLGKPAVTKVLEK